ncbi:unnamed protein product [Gongylonema pulchrum]|uniref:Uncharacterized protein n=1 Tax=Gongylonema pulchrum TaxID=637853 RepID=A0A183DJL4_9BILA|nr:unnamed protein product [Gongylonema pulchrum]
MALTLYNFHFFKMKVLQAPAIDASKHKGKILRVKDFMIRCPKCAIRSYFGEYVFFNASLYSKTSKTEKKSHSHVHINNCDWVCSPFLLQKATPGGKKCVRDIQTYELGWPQHARFCDIEDTHEVADFCRLYHEVDFALRGKSVQQDEEANATTVTYLEDLRLKGQIVNIRNLN